MVKELKTEGSFISMNNKKLANWIILNFKENYFQKEKEIIITEFSNTSKYLEHLGKTLKGVELIEATEKFIKEHKKKQKLKKNS